MLKVAEAMRDGEAGGGCEVGFSRRSERWITTSRVVFFQAEDGIRDSVASGGLGDVYKEQDPRKNDKNNETRSDKEGQKMLVFNQLLFFKKFAQFLAHVHDYPPRGPRRLQAGALSCPYILLPGGGGGVPSPHF